MIFFFPFMPGVFGGHGVAVKSRSMSEPKFSGAGPSKPDHALYSSLRSLYFRSSISFVYHRITAVAPGDFSKTGTEALCVPFISLFTWSGEWSA